jgi:hypothetical protein
VKTCLQPKPAGGTGKLQLDWRLPPGSPAELVGIVDLEHDRAWLFRKQEFESKAQQQTDDRLHLYFYVDPNYQARDGCHERDFEPFKVEHRMFDLFGIPESST